MKTYKIKPLKWVDSLDKTIATANDSGGLRYTATASGVALYDEGEYQWSAKCKSLARGKQLAEELRLERIELNLEEVDQEPVDANEALVDESAWQDLMAKAGTPELAEPEEPTDCQKCHVPLRLNPDCEWPEDQRLWLCGSCMTDLAESLLAARADAGKPEPVEPEDESETKWNEFSKWHESVWGCPANSYGDENLFGAFKAGKAKGGQANV